MKKIGIFCGLAFLLSTLSLKAQDDYPRVFCHYYEYGEEPVGKVNWVIILYKGYFLKFVLGDFEDEGSCGYYFDLQKPIETGIKKAISDYEFIECFQLEPYTLYSPNWHGTTCLSIKGFEVDSLGRGQIFLDANGLYWLRTKRWNRSNKFDSANENGVFGMTVYKEMPKSKVEVFYKQYLRFFEEFFRQKSLPEFYYAKENVPFFEFDSIVHYKMELNDKDLAKWKLRIKDTSTLNLLDKVLYSDFPGGIDDTAFLKSLSGLKYSVCYIKQCLDYGFDWIFSNKGSTNQFAELKCLPVYRDILVFRKKGKISGIAKICLGCDKAVLIGANGDTRWFGQFGEFEVLRKFLPENIDCNEKVQMKSRK